MTTTAPTFRDTTQLYEVLDGLFTAMSSRDDIAAALLAGGFVLRFRYREPDGEVTVDLRGPEIRWELGQSALVPDLELIQSADVAHRFWLGELNVPLAIAARQVVARGQIKKALALLPAVKPAFPLYRGVLGDLGLSELCPQPSRRARGAGAAGDGRGASGPAARLLEHAPWLPGGAELGATLDGLMQWVGDSPLGSLLQRVGAPLGVSAAGGRAAGRQGRAGAGSDDAPPPTTTHAIPLLDPRAAKGAHDPEAGTITDATAATVAAARVALPIEVGALQVEMLRRMELIRAFEQTLADLYADGRVPTEAIHLSIGQEACAVGVCFALRSDDYIATTHRGHGHMLAKGAPVDRMMAEIMGRATGLCGGKGGSMHVTDATVGAIGANGIVGASPLIAAGAAHSIKRRGGDQVAVAFFGDGATNQGMFHEAMNFAAVFELPAVFVCENNLYGEFTPLSAHTRVASLADRALAYNMPAATVDGNDVWAVYQAMGQAVRRARGGGGPTLLVCETYRWHGHMEGESASYRPPEEIERWKACCPLAGWRGALLERDVLDAEGADACATAAREEVAAALAFALASAEPDEAALVSDVFAPEPAALFRPAGSAGAAERETRAREISCSEAISEALAEELARDDAVYLLGEDVTSGGYFAVTAGLVERFGRQRIIDTPISEYAIVGSAVGAAMTGSRPVAEILFSDFLTTCMDPIVNNAAKLRYMSGGQYRVPLVVRTPGGAGLGMAAQHSQSLEPLLCGVPGLIVIAPGTPADAKGLLRAAIRSNNPVLFFENKLLYTATGPVPHGEHLVPIGVADVKRAGRDVTVVPIGAALLVVAEAARALAAEGVDVEIVDPRTLVPLDLAAIVRSVRKTGRLVTVEEAPLTHGFGAEIVARVTRHAFSSLRSAPRRVAAYDVPIPYNSALERAAIPDPQRVIDAVRQTLS